MGDVGNPLDQAAMEMQRWEWEGGRVIPVEKEEIAKRLRINDQSANEAAAAARAGDTDAAREILSDFVFAIDRWSERTWSGAIPWAYVRYIADAFQKILSIDPGHAEVALGIKSTRAGRRPGNKKHDDEALAAAYWYLIRRGYAPEKANALLSEKTEADRTTIQRASKAQGNRSFGDSQLIDDETLKVLMQPYAAEIAAILAADTNTP